MGGGGERVREAYFSVSSFDIVLYIVIFFKKYRSNNT